MNVIQILRIWVFYKKTWQVQICLQVNSAKYKFVELKSYRQSCIKYVLRQKFFVEPDMI